MQVPFTAIFLLCYFTIFIHDPFPNDPNKLGVLSHKGVTTTVETSCERFIGFCPKEIHLEGGNYHAYIIMYYYFLNPLLFVITFTWNKLTDNYL